MRVIFVDDEPNILNGLRRILRPMRNDWQMEFMEAGDDALDALAQAPCDVIVSDMKMPGMDGAQLLSEVKKRYPNSIRIALSGETDSHMIYRCVQHAHQYLAKPCDPDALVSAVRRAFTLRELMHDKVLERIVADMTSLPSLPDAYEKIMRELQSEEPSLQVVAEIVETDVAMTAKILQLVNSAFFGLTRNLSSPSEAAMFLGVDVLKSLVLTTGVLSQFDESVVSPGELKSIWNRSLHVGTLARQIMLQETKDKLQSDYAYMGGLLSDVGSLIIASNLPDKFAAVAKMMDDESRPQIEVEREIIGHSHTEVGAYLIGLWGLPNQVVECVAYHHEPAGCLEAGFAPVTAVHAATAIVAANGAPDPGSLDSDYIEKLGLTQNIPAWLKLNSAVASADKETQDE